ncbi:uncharacterized protein RCO7_00090 [Rhynchosporium graminicola]|uniref:Transposase MuDR plant domain-containing protein n=1 Tax=Rhynchosporium graminicola TaxID=2792576 RepID=A0A1E1KI31_9HELO|nr:uncharacterized protein RCO7_00090 [Rhynchosporium commune]
MPPLYIRQEFPTLKAFKEALHAWAIESHFEPRILKSDTGRVRVGCKRDPECPFVVRCNWERKGGREPLARVTVLREKHTCLNGLEWQPGSGNGNGMIPSTVPGNMIGSTNNLGGPSGQHQTPGLEIRQDSDGNIMGGARVLGPISPRQNTNNDPSTLTLAPVLPKVQRNSASRLPFLMEILPRLMRIDKDTTPVEIRECLLREYGAEVHLQQCRRAKTEILKKRAEQGEVEGQGAEGNGSLDGIGSQDGEANTNMFGGELHSTPNQNASVIGAPNMNGIPGGLVAGAGPDQDFQLHTASGVVIPQVPRRSETALNAASEQAVRCPFCINHRWMRTVKDAVEHMTSGWNTVLLYMSSAIVWTFTGSSVEGSYGFGEYWSYRKAP